MFRILGRILCLLLVVTAISGGLYLLLGTHSGGPGDGLPGAFDRRAFDHDARGETLAGEEAGRRGHGPHGEHGRLSVGRGAAGAALTAIQVGVVAAVVAGVQRRSRRKTANGSALPVESRR